jgi:hypothetical protein
MIPSFHAASIRRTAATLCCLAELALHAKAQSCGSDAQTSISTDRPQVTNSSIVVPCGSLQLENGIQVTGSSGRKSPDFPATSIRFGVAGRTELRFGVPDYVRSDGANELTDLSLGLKRQFGPVRGFDLSLIPSLSFPTGSNAISSHGYDPTLLLPYSRALSKSWTLAGQFGVTAPTQSGRHNVSGQASLYFDRQLTAPWDAYVEYAGVFPQRGGPQHLVDFGTAYKLTPYQQLDLHAGVGLSSAVADYQVGFGYSVRFQVVGRGRSPVSRPVL